ncbi:MULTISPECIES: rod shape-determining protein MreC [unclassified Gilvimarinus]|uniref:rod shape-determining protein MreC n=1 Tax=unclassified Gilvimarinus TaxID=2642066 RepID=UPI0026E1195F|nr:MULTISPECIES: rod shape-determining protein MreC [unclassified Gilvimarinus]MDO6570331.1 rod shape-determining protein MreC [Gilvimarinus sp. 2_MG-2023]MDO6746882.1 rod shape-determining protein MreC [Gilvimarinus sp. 1_MG-2023]
MFTKGPAVSSRFVLFGLLAIVLILLGLYTDVLDKPRSQLIDFAKPLYQVTDWPRRINHWRQETFVARGELLQENKRLQTELLIHKRKLQQLASLSAENVRLRQLLNATELLKDDVLVAELIGVSPNPLSHTLILNRGTLDGVFSGQPVLDANGLLGQVVEVSPHSARVLLLTDPAHALPVQVNRNGVRTIAEGTGDLGMLKLRHVSNTTDIQEGDLLVSSGLGQRFPAGYPVATVNRVSRDPGQPFADIYAKPMAQMDRARNVLLVFDTKQAER